MMEFITESLLQKSVVYAHIVLVYFVWARSLTLTSYRMIAMCQEVGGMIAILGNLGQQSGVRRRSVNLKCREG